MLSILTVTYHSEQVLPGFLASFEKIRPLLPDVELLVHDNTESNIGLSRAINQLLRKAKGEYVLICNPDIIFNNSITSLIQAGEQYPDSMLVPILLNRDGSEQRVIYRRLPTIARIFCDMTYFGNFLSRIFPGIGRDYLYKNQRPLFPEQVGSVCLLVQSTTVKKLGVFYNEQFPVFWNDVDLCERAKQSGVKIQIVATATVHHHLAHSSEKSDKEMLMMLFYSENGMIGYARKWKHHPNILRLIYFLDTVFLISMKPFGRLRRRNRLDPKRDRVQGLKFATRLWILRFRCTLH